MGQQDSKPVKEAFTPQNVRLSHEDIAKLLSICPYRPQDCFIKDTEELINQTKQNSQQMTSEQTQYLKKCVGKMIAKFPKKKRKNQKGVESNKELVTNGTAAFIGENLLITAAHNVFLKEFNEMAVEIYFLPEMLNNSGRVIMIPAQKFAVFESYKQPHSEYNKFDIALVVLQMNNFSSQFACLDIDWSYKRWEHDNPCLHLFGYPTQKDKKKLSVKIIYGQDEISVKYKNTWEGESGGPLVNLEDNEESGKLNLVGIHKAVGGNYSIGLTLNNLQNSQEIVYQLAEQLQVEGRMKEYQLSCKKMPEFMKKEKNVTEKLKLLEKLQEENLRQKEEIKRLNSTIDQLKAQINTLNGNIQKMKAEQQKPMTQTTKNEEMKIQILQKQIDENLYQKLYQHLQRTISKEREYYGEWGHNKYQNKAVSKKEVEEETVKYLNYLKQNIKSLPPQHQQQLFFLIDFFDSQDKCIINWYHISSKYQDSTGPAKFYLDFNSTKQRIDLKQFLSFNNWNHLVALSFSGCGWFNDDDWRALVECAANFNNLKRLYLWQNKISAIKEGDIEQFKFLEEIRLCKLLIKTIEYNPLTVESKQVLENIKQKNNNKIKIYYSVSIINL